MRFDNLIIIEPNITPKKDTVMKMGMKDFENKIVHNREGSFKPTIWIITKRGSKVDKLTFIRQYVSVLFNYSLVIIVHGLSMNSLRRELWQHLHNIFGNIQGIVIGDFNCILRYDEKKGGTIVSLRSMAEF